MRADHALHSEISFVPWLQHRDNARTNDRTECLAGQERTAMKLELGQSKLRLGREQLIAVRDGVGVRVTCVAGAVWITEEQAGKDVILDAGESHTITHPGLTLVMALRAASLCMHEPRVSLWTRLASWLERLVPNRLAPRGIG
jgi:hypothetical protein